MNLKGGTCLFLLIMASAVSAKSSAWEGKNKMDRLNMMKQLIIKCHDKGSPMPQMTLSKTTFRNSTMPGVQDDDQSEALLSSFLSILDSAEGRSRAETIQLLFDLPDKMANVNLTCSSISGINERLKGNPESSSCTKTALMALLSWEATKSLCEDISPKVYRSLLWTAKPLLESRSIATYDLPAKLNNQKLGVMMEMLQEVYNSTTDNEKSFVAKWAREQIVQNKYNCTMKTRSKRSSRRMKRCKAKLPWLGSEEMNMTGSYTSRLAPEDIESSPARKMCEFFNTKKFTSMSSFKSPTMCKTFLRRFKECFSEKEFAKLGPLVCCLRKVPPVKPDVASRLLTQLDQCESPRPPPKNLRKHLVRLATSNSSIGLALSNVGKDAIFLPVQKYLDLPLRTLKEYLKKLTLQLKPEQQCMLVKKSPGTQCKTLSFKELRDVLSVMKAVPKCLIKLLKSEEVLKDVETLKILSKSMTKAQMKAMLKKLPFAFLRQKMFGSLACAVSLRSMRKANFTELDQAENKTWCRTQAAFLVKKLYKEKKFKLRRLPWIIQGLTCKMIENADDEFLAQGMKESPHWFSKHQARCAAMKLLKTLEKKRNDFFKTITAAELTEIPSDVVPHIPPSKLEKLPDAVCPVFLMKIEKANLTLLPSRAWTRPALIKRALRCLTNGTDLSGLTMTDVSKLGQLVCELPPDKLRLLDAEVLNLTLQQMADCQRIPRRHRKELLQLLRETYGNFSEWDAETMENVGTLLLLDDNATSALPNKPWMKDILNFLRPRISHPTDAFKQKWFEVASKPSSDAADNDNGTNGEKAIVKGPTEEQIVDVGPDGSCYWSVEQLHGISNDTFLATVDTLGECRSFSAEKLKVLTKRATEVFGSVSQMNECQVTQLRCVSRGFSDSDLEQLPFSLDSLEELQHCDWTETQMRSVWRGIAKRGNLTADKMEAEEMVSLNRFICGLDAGEIQQLNPEEFGEAVGSMAALACSSEKAEALIRLAVSSLGEPSTWDEAQTNELCSVLPGLSSPELSSLEPSVLPFVCSSSIPQIPPVSFSALSVDQLRSLGPDNAAMVTRAQLDLLSEEQQAAVEEAATGASYRSMTSENSVSYSGAPALSVEGASAFMKSVLLLCMGFMLL